MALGNTFRRMFRDFVTEGVSASGKWRPRKDEIVARGKYLDWLQEVPGTGGTTAAYTLSFGSSISPVTPDRSTVIAFTVHDDNVAGCTLNIGGTGNKLVTVPTSDGSKAIPALAMRVGIIYYVWYQTTLDVWQLLNPSFLIGPTRVHLDSPSGLNPLAIRRDGSDGILIAFLRDASGVGNISVANGVVSYNSLCGGR